MAAAPVIFCHYGYTPYLPFTVKCAAHSNPEKPIYFLGDDNNRRLARQRNVRHFNLADYESSALIREFDSVFQVIQGDAYKFLEYRNGGHWIKFVFRRFFHLYEFLQRHGIKEHWHFDSDNLMVVDFAPLERFYGQIDTKVFIRSAEKLRGFLESVIENFRDEAFLETQRQRVAGQYDAFTEMEAFRCFVEAEKIDVWHVQDLHKSSFIDECLAQPEVQNVESEQFFDQRIKKVYLTPEGGFFVRSLATGEFWRLNSLNCSWLDHTIYPRILAHARRYRPDRPCSELHENLPTLAQMQLPWLYRLAKFFKSIRFRKRRRNGLSA